MSQGDHPHDQFGAEDKGVGRLGLGERLRERLDEVIDAYIEGVRSDPSIPGAASISRPLLEDHSTSFLADLFQSLVVLEASRGPGENHEQSELLRDGGQIQRLIAELHGSQRHRLGWTEEALGRDLDILYDQVEALARRLAPGGEHDDDLRFALDVLDRLLGHASEASFRGYRAAAVEN